MTPVAGEEADTRSHTDAHMYTLRLRQLVNASLALQWRISCQQHNGDSKNWTSAPVTEIKIKDMVVVMFVLNSTTREGGGGGIWGFTSCLVLIACWETKRKQSSQKPNLY